MWIIDPLYLIMVAPALILAIFAQFKVKAAFSRYSRVRNSSGMTGAEAARRMLDSAGIRDVSIEQVQGFLSDHYDPSKKVVRLSPDVYGGQSLAAVGVACHEVGHAIQHAKKYAPLVVRNAAVPAASFGSGLGIWLAFFGIIFNWGTLLWLGIILFGAVVFFQLVNLPVEFNASTRAKQMLPQLGIISGPKEEKGVKSVLGAAALTYVAATLQSVMILLYLVMRGSSD